MDEPRTEAGRALLDEWTPFGDAPSPRAAIDQIERESLRLARDAVRHVGDRILIDPSDPDPEDVIVDALAAIDRLMEDAP